MQLLLKAIRSPVKAMRILRKRLFASPEKKRGNAGYCPLCEKETFFEIRNEWLRDNYLCTGCWSIPRQRAFITVLNQQYPNWINLQVHESSPDGASSEYIKKRAQNYSASQYYPDKQHGEQVGEFTCQDLSALTFANASFDLILTQDVFEHVIDPEKAFAEIARVLKPGGAHVFTMPWYPALQKTRIRAVLEHGEVKLLEKAEYHGNPVSNEGSLVTRDWGLDFPGCIFQHGGLFTSVFVIRDRGLGIDGEFLEVFVSKKI